MAKCKQCGVESETLFEVVYQREVCSDCQCEIENHIREEDEFKSLSEEY